MLHSLQANKLALPVSWMLLEDEIPGPETKDFIIYSTANSISIRIFVPVPQAQIPTRQ